MLKADRLELQDHAGVFLKWITPERARELVEVLRWGEYRATKRKVRAVQLALPSTGSPDEPEFVSLKILDKGTSYVHRNETRENPKGVWTLRKLPGSLRPFFMMEAP